MVDNFPENHGKRAATPYDTTRSTRNSHKCDWHTLRRYATAQTAPSSDKCANYVIDRRDATSVQLRAARIEMQIHIFLSHFLELRLKNRILVLISLYKHI